MGGPCRCAGVATETSKRCGSSRSGLPPPRHEALTATSTIDFTELRRIPFRLFSFLPFRPGPVSGTFQSPSTADVREFTAARTLYSNRLNATPVRRRMREYREPQRIAFHAGPDTLRTGFLAGHLRYVARQNCAQRILRRGCRSGSLANGDLSSCHKLREPVQLLRCAVVET
jgi:hypothetical protein